jgi:two-component system, OmpR family, sensor kinase
MKAPRSLEARLALAIGVGVTLLWVAAAMLTANILRHEMNEVFDSALEETAQRILPLAVQDIIGGDDKRLTQRIATLRRHIEYFTYIVRDEEGRVLLRSHDADETIFPPYQGMGFRNTATHRLYYDAALQQTVTIAVAEPLEHRATVAREMQGALALPLLIMIPLSLMTIFAAVRLSFRSVRQLKNDLAARSVQDLSAVQEVGLPSEIAPIAAAVNHLLLRLKTAFEAERSFAANAAHELRNPVAGAIAQAQRLQAETTDRQAAQRAAEIEATLKRLARLSEKLMQLARAEGSRLRSSRPADLRPVLRVIVADFERAGGAKRLHLGLPPEPVLSDVDPDAFGILCRNLIENALTHSQAGTPVSIYLEAQGRLIVTNEGVAIPPEILARLTSRFERAAVAGEGSGLGLAIVRTIAERAGGSLVLRSPIAGHQTGFEATVSLPVEELLHPKR